MYGMCLSLCPSWCSPRLPLIPKKMMRHSKIRSFPWRRRAQSSSLTRGFQFLRGRVWCPRGLRWVRSRGANAWSTSCCSYSDWRGEKLCSVQRISKGMHSSAFRAKSGDSSTKSVCLVGSNTRISCWDWRWSIEPWIGRHFSAKFTKRRSH